MALLWCDREGLTPFNYISGSIRRHAGSPGTPLHELMMAVAEGVIECRCSLPAVVLRQNSAMQLAVFYALQLLGNREVSRNMASCAVGPPWACAMVEWRNAFLQAAGCHLEAHGTALRCLAHAAQTTVAAHSPPAAAEGEAPVAVAADCKAPVAVAADCKAAREEEVLQRLAQAEAAWVARANGYEDRISALEAELARIHLEDHVAFILERSAVAEPLPEGMPSAYNETINNNIQAFFLQTLGVPRTCSRAESQQFVRMVPDAVAPLSHWLSGLLIDDLWEGSWQQMSSDFRPSDWHQSGEGGAGQAPAGGAGATGGEDQPRPPRQSPPNGVADQPVLQPAPGRAATAGAAATAQPLHSPPAPAAAPAAVGLSANARPSGTGAGGAGASGGRTSRAPSTAAGASKPWRQQSHAAAEATGLYRDGDGGAGASGGRTSRAPSTAAAASKPWRQESHAAAEAAGGSGGNEEWTLLFHKVIKVERCITQAEASVRKLVADVEVMREQQMIVKDEHTRYVRLIQDHYDSHLI
eukprot:NODE_2770_length_2148_cov_4.374072.p1 GENE.NODE_2770_length_2148_cov_4.374072~~NODE_2770_length_2148_cov_4.374072.p1  ORF type:complete len:548 (-),score=105.09 NODE_2770_length_2148_cov_4.374072:504-2084(-)